MKCSDLYALKFNQSRSYLNERPDRPLGTARYCPAPGVEGRLILEESKTVKRRKHRVFARVFYNGCNEREQRMMRERDREREKEVALNGGGESAGEDADHHHHHQQQSL